MNENLSLSSLFSLFASLVVVMLVSVKVIRQQQQQIERGNKGKRNVSILFANGKGLMLLSSYNCTYNRNGNESRVYGSGRVTHLCLCFLCSAGTIDFISPLNSDSICSETSYMKPGSYSIWLWKDRKSEKKVEFHDVNLIKEVLWMDVNASVNRS